MKGTDSAWSQLPLRDHHRQGRATLQRSWGGVGNALTFYRLRILLWMFHWTLGDAGLPGMEMTMEMILLTETFLELTMCRQHCEHLMCTV